MNPPRTCSNNPVAFRTQVLCCVLILISISVVSESATPTRTKRDLQRNLRRLTLVEELLSRSDEALEAHHGPSGLACLREACGLAPGDKRIHWKMALAAEISGEREVGRRALLVLVHLDPSLEENEQVLALANRLAALRAPTRFKWDRKEEPQSRPEFTWSEFYKPSNPKNLIIY